MARIVIEEPCKTCEGTGSVSGWPDTPWELCPTCKDDNGVHRRVLDPGSYALIEKVDGEWPAWALGVLLVFLNDVVASQSRDEPVDLEQLLDALAGGEQP